MKIVDEDVYEDYLYYKIFILLKKRKEKHLSGIKTIKT